MFEKAKIDKLNLSVLGILIRVARIEQGYSLRNLSALTNISHTLISNIEMGKQPPSEATLADLFRVLNLKFFTSPEIEKEMTYFYNTIFTHIINHHYKDAALVVRKMEKKGNMYENSFEVVNYLLIRCLFYTITDTHLNGLDNLISQYEKVLDFFTPHQKQLCYFIKGLNHLNKDEYSLASTNLEQALKLGNKNTDVVIKEYLVRSYIYQFKFTDSVSIATSAIEEFEEKTIYVRAMHCRILIARVYLRILKLDKAQKLIAYVESFARQFKISHLTDECHTVSSGIYFFKNEYDEAIKELELHSDQDSKHLILPRFRIYLMNKDLRLLEYYKEVMSYKKDIITSDEYLLIKVLMMWVNEDIREDEDYVDSLKELAELSIKSNNQEVVGLTHNLLIMYYKEHRKYKKALEISETLLLHKKIHISYYSIKND